VFVHQICSQTDPDQQQGESQEEAAQQTNDTWGKNSESHVMVGTGENVDPNYCLDAREEF
jgi:hypothetical protein